jgi:lipopolysaccharide/colanic/teichoic acid biosynthesis glycosyltransferase
MTPSGHKPVIVNEPERKFRRVLDTVIALLLLVGLSPVLIIVAMLIIVTSPGRLLYKQKRVGKDGQLFDIYKFRTMCQDADSKGPFVTSADDKRITPIGRWLRNSKLDELPQLLNVLRGDMSLVGPRPQVPRFVEHFEPTLRSVVLCVPPGITGPTALKFRNEEQLLANKPDREAYYIENILPVKLEMDAQYVRTRCLSYDARIFGQTASLFLTAPFRRVPRLLRRLGGRKSESVMVLSKGNGNGAKAQSNGIGKGHGVERQHEEAFDAQV